MRPTNDEPEYRRWRREKAIRDEQEAERQQFKSEHESKIEKIASAIHRLEKDLQRSNNENSAQRKSDRLWDRLSVAGLWVAAAVGVAAIWVSSGDSSKQYTVMSGQLDEMKKQQVLTRTQMRANLRRTGIQMTAVANNGNLIGWEVSPAWTNVGATEARSYVSWFEIRPYSGRPLGKIDCPAATPPRDRPNPLVVSPGNGMVHVAKRLSIEDVVKAQRGAGYILIVGHIEYRDIFPDTPLHLFDWCVLAEPNDVARSIFSFPSVREETD